MNRRERFLSTMTFGTPDRPAAADYPSYDSTRRRWEQEGLPRDADLNDYFGMDFDPFRWNVGGVNVSIVPGFEHRVLEETADYRVEQRGGGEIVRVLRNVPPPAMPQWIRYPLTCRTEWPAFRQRLSPDTPGRLPANLAAIAAESAARDHPLGMWVGSTYGYMRDWWGLEALSLLFFDEPALIEEMIEVVTHLSVTALRRVTAAGVKLDWVMFWEDMACRSGPLMSPQMFRRFCAPFYRRVMEAVNAAGVKVVMVDSDGDVRPLVPLWLDLGVHVMHPMEVASGMDIREERRKYGKQVAFFGGIDKRALAGSRAVIDAEVIPKLRAGFADGGFIPACDHAVPPDVSLDNYRYFRDLVNRCAREVYGPSAG